VSPEYKLNQPTEKARSEKHERFRRNAANVAARVYGAGMTFAGGYDIAAHILKGSSPDLGTAIDMSVISMAGYLAVKGLGKLERKRQSETEPQIHDEPHPTNVPPYK